MIDIIAVSDIHSPKYLKEFKESLKKIKKKPDLVCFAGDLILKGKVNEYNRIIEIVDKFEFENIIAIFGNEEYNPLYNEINEITAGKIKFLNDESITMKLKDKTIGIVGSKGSLDRPTYWQSKYMPDIVNIYTERYQ